MITPVKRKNMTKNIEPKIRKDIPAPNKITSNGANIENEAIPVGVMLRWQTFIASCSNGVFCFPGDIEN